MNTSSIAIGQSGERAEIGEVILYSSSPELLNNSPEHMVILRDVSMYDALIETEDGETKWVSRKDLRSV